MKEGFQTLDDLLGDPTIQLVMARDGWQAEDIRKLMHKARDRSGERAMVPPAHVVEKRWSPCAGL
jgi:hypothetical protein